jgi:predicted transcriptional regulator
MELSNDDDFNENITAGLVVRDGINISINADLLADGEDNIMEYFRITNCDIHDIDGISTWQKIHYGGINFQVFGNKAYTEYGTSGYYFQDVRIEDNYFDKCELHAIQFGFNWFYDRASGMGEYDETGKWHEGWEQLWVRTRDLYSRDVYIGSNYAENTGQGAIQLANIKNLLCEYNEVNGFLKRYDQVSAGLYLWAGTEGVMQFNEVYDGPANQYDATPWDLEFTNFDVTYQYNYSHDNKGGWMSYMGNSSNSIARYNLSVNDNGVILKNMLSTNYAPTYLTNNVFVYDGSILESIHDEVIKDTVYFTNNIFYNTSQTPTNWNRREGGLDKAVFSNNAYYEASGVKSPKHPADANEYFGDPGFAGNPLDYNPQGIGVENIREAAANYKLKEDSPLIDAGSYIAAAGTQDFFGTPLCQGEDIDIGIHEVIPYDHGETDFTALENAIDNAKAMLKKEEKYTASSWAAFITAYESAQSVASAHHSSQEVVDEAVNALHAGQAGLVLRGDAVLIELALSLVQDFVPEGFAAEAEWLALQDAIAGAQAILAKPAEEITVSEVEVIVMELLGAQALYSQERVEIANLKEMLLTLIEEAETLVENQEDYTPQSIENLISLIENAKNIYQSSTVSMQDVSDAIDSLLSGIQYVIERGDKTGLTILVNMADKINDALYTTDSMADLNDAKADAIAIIDNANADDEMVQGAYDALMDAMSNLVRVRNDFVLLDKALALAEEVLNNVEAYRPSTIAGLEAVYREALAVRNSEAPGQKEIDRVYKLLMEAVQEARFKANIVALAGRVKMLKELALAPVAAPFVPEIEDVIKNAEDIIKDDDADQEAVDQLIPQIDQLIEAIQAKVEDQKEDTPEANVGFLGDVIPDGNGAPIGQTAYASVVPYESGLRARVADNVQDEELETEGSPGNVPRGDAGVQAARVSDQKVVAQEQGGEDVEEAQNVVAMAGLIGVQPAVLVGVGIAFLGLLCVAVVLGVKVRRNRV